MRFGRFSIGALCLYAFSLLACNSSPDHAGIEIGNPEIQAHSFSAHFFVDYGSGEMADSVQLDGLKLSLSKLSAYSSYYIYVSFDAKDGMTLWPDVASDAPMQIAFTKDSSTTLEDWMRAFGDISIDDEGLLKEIGAHFAPVASAPQVTGSLKMGEEVVPFVFSLAGLDSFELRYVTDRLDTAENGAIALTVRFSVPEWTRGLSMTTSAIDGDTVRFDALHNALLWDSLTNRFVKAFAASHYATYYSNGVSEEEYAEDLLLRYDVIDSNWVSNGTFENGDDWILVRQLGGYADTSIANNTISVNVTYPGPYSYSVQLIHEDIPLLQGRKYKLVFTAYAKDSANVTVRIGSYSTYDTEAFQKHVTMEPIWKSYEFEYTALVDDLFARLEFNLGKNQTLYQFKDVKIFRID
ncbi:MAG: carbohydrate binding domain-containing protein [Fibrobacter sp.]|nr:carbohydrate binding domain-containing protein [Fibrobacter sp.]